MVTDRDVERFTTGDCHVLARAIHRLTGWQMAALWDEEQYCPNFHVFVLHPNGWALDVLGLRNPDEIINEWGDERTPVVAVTWDELLRTGWPRHAYGEYSFRRARVIAKRLVEQYA